MMEMEDLEEEVMNPKKERKDSRRPSIDSRVLGLELSRGGVRVSELTAITGKRSLIFETILAEFGSGKF